LQLGINEETIRAFVLASSLVFLVPSQLGINEETIHAQPQARNNASDGGRVCVGEQFLTIDPRGGFESVDE